MARSLTPDEHFEMMDILLSEGRLAALAFYRDVTCADLETAWKYIDTLYQDHRSELEKKPHRKLNPAEENELYHLAASESALFAIARYRELTGSGIEPANDYVDALLRELDAGCEPSTLPRDLLDECLKALLAGSKAGGPKDSFVGIKGNWREEEKRKGMRYSRILLEYAYEVCDQCHSSLMTMDQGVTEMRRKFPEFSAGLYQKAWGFGMFVMR